MIRRGARSARARSRAAAATIWPPVPSPGVRFAEASALPVWRPLPINSVGDRVTNCLHSFALNGGFANNPANRELYVRSCVNNRPDTA
jgi:hypothetical protein